jgi:predicted  nucleic acid-binding Zn-ribbon protein
VGATFEDLMAAIGDLSARMERRFERVEERLGRVEDQLGTVVAEQKRLADGQAAQGERMANIDGQLLQIGLRIGDINSRLPVPIAWQPSEPRRQSGA